MHDVSQERGRRKPCVVFDSGQGQACKQEDRLEIRHDKPEDTAVGNDGIMAVIQRTVGDERTYGNIRELQRILSFYGTTQWRDRYGQCHLLLGTVGRLRDVRKHMS